MPQQKEENIYSALMIFQQNVKPVVKNFKAEVGKFNYRYASLGDMLDAVLPELHANNVVLFQPLHVNENGTQTLITVLHHVPSGTEITSEYLIKAADMNDPQKVGGAVTYARRYAAFALLGLAPEDDDGANAGKPRELTIGEKFTQKMKADGVNATRWGEISTELFGKLIPTKDLSDDDKLKYLSSSRTIPPI